MNLLVTDSDCYSDSGVLDLSCTSMRQLRMRNDADLRRSLDRLEDRSARVQVSVGNGGQTAERVD